MRPRLLLSKAGVVTTATATDRTEPTCPKCQSERVMTGPFYSRQSLTCAACGHRWESK